MARRLSVSRQSMGDVALPEVPVPAASIEPSVKSRRLAKPSQQAVNKKKQKILKKLKLKTVDVDLPLELLVQLYGI